MATTQCLSPKSHVCIFGYQAWGHVRPMCTLSARIVKSRPFYVTFFIPLSSFDKVNYEIARNFTDDEVELRALIRVVGVVNDALSGVDTTSLDTAYEDGYRRLTAGQSVTCAQTGTDFEPISKPNVVVFDFFAKTIYDSVDSISGKSVGKYIFYTGAANSLFYLFGPEHVGGRGDLLHKIEAEVARTGRPLNEVETEIVLGVKGDVVRVPGMPPMYDYEYRPQFFPMPSAVVPMFLTTQDLLAAADGMLLGTPELYEPEQVAAVRAWFAETGRKVYAIGPSLPLNDAVVAPERQLTDKGLEIERFMDTTLEHDGPLSLVYISFGTFFWSTEPEKIWAFLDVLMQRNLPFILSHASPLAVVPEAISQKIQQYGKGMLSSWSPQQNILLHPVTGWFVTHGGHNSIIESLSLGVPMMVWPFHADQPTNAIHTSEKLDVAYELLEVRTGHGLKPRFRTNTVVLGTIDSVKREAREVLEKAFGEDGERKRANARKFQDQLANAWAEQGPSRRELEAFLDTVV